MSGEPSSNALGALLEGVEAGAQLSMKVKAHDAVNHPKHYTSHPAKCECGKSIECIQITEHMNFCLGNAVKYIWRAGEKGDALEDLQKARWYLDREIALRSKQK